MGEPYGYAIARMLRSQLEAHSAADHVIALEDGLASVTRERDEWEALADRHAARADLLGRERDALREALGELVEASAGFMECGTPPPVDYSDWAPCGACWGCRLHAANQRGRAALAPTESEGRQEDGAGVRVECRGCDASVWLPEATGGVSILSAALDGWEFTSETSWRCPSCARPTESEGNSDG